jgi:tetratricopeptide (TPR) repeat protein
LERAVGLREQRAPGSVALAITLDNLGSVCGRMGEFARAEQLHRAALETFRATYGPFDGHVAATLTNLSNVYERQGEFDQVEAYRLRALDIYLRTVGLPHGSTVQAITQVVQARLARGDLEGADRLVNELLSIGGSSPRPAHRALAGVLVELTRPLSMGSGWTWPPGLASGR